MYKKLKRGGLTPGLKNYVKKDNSEEALIKAFKKNSNLAIFVKKSEIMKNPGDYTPVEGNLEKMLKPKNKKTGGISKIDKLRSTEGQFTIGGRLQTLKDKMKKTFGKKSGGLTGGQKKLDKNKDGKITGEDFKMMKQGYGAARKDGMGLQDEKVKPGKVQKAFLGIMALKKAKDKGAKGAEFLSPLAMLKRISGKKKGGVAKGGGADMGTEMSDKRKKKFKFIMDRLKSPTTINIREDYKPGTKSPMQRDRKREGYRAKVESLGGKVLFADEMSKGGGADTGRMGEIKSMLALARDKFKKINPDRKPSEYDFKKIRDLIKKQRDPRQMQKSKSREDKPMQPLQPVTQRMGGGMMQRPMGYKDGTKPGAGPLGAAGLRQPTKKNIDQIIKDQKFPPISVYIEDKKKPQKPFPVPSLYNNNKKPSAGRIRKGEPRPKKMGEPIGFKSGTMVKARGCKLGRTRPTKMY
jgi:hypothetical protein